MLSFHRSARAIRGNNIVYIQFISMPQPHSIIELSMQARACVHIQSTRSRTCSHIGGVFDMARRGWCVAAVREHSPPRVSRCRNNTHTHTPNKAPCIMSGATGSFGTQIYYMILYTECVCVCFALCVHIFMCMCMHLSQSCTRRHRRRLQLC